MKNNENIFNNLSNIIIFLFKKIIKNFSMKFISYSNKILLKFKLNNNRLSRFNSFKNLV